MDIVAGLSAASQGIQIVKALRDLDKSIDSSTLKIRVNELLGNLVDAKEALLDAKEASADKDLEIARLKAAFAVQSALVEGRDGYKYRPSADGTPDGYPACPRCEQVDGRIIFLVPDQHWQRGQCPACDKKFAPIYPYNSDGEREELAQQARDEQIISSYGSNPTTGY